MTLTARARTLDGRLRATITSRLAETFSDVSPSESEQWSTIIHRVMEPLSPATP